MISFVDRVSKIVELSDIQGQIHKAERYSKAIRIKSKSAASLDSKVALLQDQRTAESVARDLKLAQFIIEDGLCMGKSGVELAEWSQLTLNLSKRVA